MTVEFVPVRASLRVLLWERACSGGYGVIEEAGTYGTHRPTLASLRKKVTLHSLHSDSDSGARLCLSSRPASHRGHVDDVVSLSH